VEYFPELSEGRVKGGNLDAVLGAMFEEGEKFGVLIEFAGGGHHHSEVFSKTVFQWRMAGVFFIRFEDIEAVEEDLRDLLGRLSLIFHDDPRLGGLSPYARLVDIDIPEPSTINDVPFYWLPFMVTVVDR
jgi:hypothetical protein